MPGGVAWLSEGNTNDVGNSLDVSGYVARWTEDGRRLADIRYDQAVGGMLWSLKGLAAAATPGGGFAIATTKGIFRTNAVGSSVCQGCGPPAPSCDDKEPCTADACSPSLADCTHVAIPGCKKSLGTCLADADCDDGEPCTADTCAKATGACSHAAQATCLIGNRCVGGVGGSCATACTGHCLAGVCTPELSTKADNPSSAITTGWAAALDTARPQLHETADGGLHIAGGWHAARYQANGVQRWRHPQPGRIAASAPAAKDGLLLAMMQPLDQVQTGKTRFVRLSAQGRVVKDTLLATGVTETAFDEPWSERKRWLVPDAKGGHVLVATLGWTANAWKGRLVTLSAELAVTATVDVTLPGIGPGDVPWQRTIEQVWPAEGGGLLLAWRRIAQGDEREWGAARLALDGTVAWSQPLVAGPMLAAGFDPWRPRALVVRDPPASWQTIVALLPTGPAAAPDADLTDVGQGIGTGKFAASTVLAFAELPGVRAVAASYMLSKGTMASGYYPVSKGKWISGKPPLYPEIYSNLEILQSWIGLHGHAVADTYVLANGRVVLVACGPPGWYVNPALIVLDDNGRFKPCGMHPMQQNCLTPGGFCNGL